MLETLLDRALLAHGGVAKSLALAMGVQQAAISKWRRRKHLPSLANMLKLAKVTGDDPVEVCTAYIEKNRNGRSA